MKKSNFNCGQDALIEAVVLIWTYCKVRITRMSGFKSKYTSSMCDLKIAEAQAILLMPDNAARQSVHEMARVSLQGIVDSGRSMWQDLKCYVRDAYTDTAEYDIKLGEAGWSYYQKSATSWTKAKALFASTVNFINANRTALQDQGYMPDAFADTFIELQSNFEVAFVDYMTKVQQSEEGTDERMDVCNAIFASVMECCADGQRVFKNEDAIKNEFVFSAVVEKVDPSGPASLKGYATYIINGEPVVGMTAEIEAINKRVVMNDEGFYDFGPLTGGVNYTVKYVLGDVVKDTEVVTVPVGTTVHKNVEIEN